jgi:hypothetical protein
MKNEAGNYTLQILTSTSPISVEGGEKKMTKG